ncbi:cytoplasmic protein [Candidatus Chlorohelix sp.]|uniref:cytoplasmic protein n=1 Tax=Candidatus Chlorohelix sp. TaxID=3139201 RepID=UPI00303FEF2E
MKSEQAIEFSFNNRKQLEESDRAACYHCCKIFDPSEIQVWFDGGFTAICPYCGIDAVLASKAGFQFTDKVLGELRKKWF